MQTTFGIFKMAAIDETCKEQHPHLVERDKPKNRNRLDKLFCCCHGNKTGGILFFFIPFIKLHELNRNIHRSVWQLLRGLNKFKMAAVAMVTKVQKMLNSLQTADPFETWHKNRSSLKVVLFVFKIFKMATISKWLPIKNQNKLLKIPKWKDFNGNGYLQGVRHATPYCGHFGLLWRPIWIQNDRQNTKILPIWAKFGFQVDYNVANWYPNFTGMLSTMSRCADYFRNFQAGDRLFLLF